MLLINQILQKIPNFKIRLMMKMIWICLALVIQQTYSYLDITLNVHRQKNYISYTVPFTINKNMQYALTTTFNDTKQFIMSLSKKAATDQKSKKHKSVSISVNGPLTGILKASSLEGYSFQGWKRFFMEALLYMESRYYHQIIVNFDNVVMKKQVDQFMRDGVISFGPNLTNNKIYQMIKNGSQYVKNDIVSIYRGVNDKNVRMQLGGFQESFARGHRNGILFYQMDIYADDGRWWIPIKTVICVRERNGRMDSFYITNSQLNLSLSIQSPYLKFPMSYATQLQRNFEAVHTTCKVTQQNFLSCSNMTSIDLALNFINLQIDSGASINISLYDLKDSYDQKTGQTIFYIQFVPNLKQLQIGQALFKSYYVSVDMEKKKMLFSPINRFPSDSYGVYVIRFFVAFGIFTVVTAIGAMIWQTFNDPFKKNKFMYGQDGVRLVSYQRANEINQNDQ